MSEIEKFVLDTILDTVEDVEIDENTALLDEDILNSISIMYLIAETEEKYGIKIDLKDINEKKFSTVKNISAFIESLLSD